MRERSRRGMWEQRERGGERRGGERIRERVEQVSSEERKKHEASIEER